MPIFIHFASEMIDFGDLSYLFFPKTKVFRGVLGIYLDLVETYMMLGGIPYYLSLLNRQESLAQNIDRLYFRKNAELSQEYRRLYSSLFKHPEPYVKIVESLAKNKRDLHAAK